MERRINPNRYERPYGNPRDSEAPIPYVRRHLPTVETTVYRFEAEQPITKTVTKTLPDRTQEVITEVYTETKSHKVYLKTYSQSSEEDTEHFFEAFEQLQLELTSQWKAISRKKTNDSTLLFDAFTHILRGTAHTEWLDVLRTDNDRDWAVFKELVSVYICTKVLPEDAYDHQVSYMQARSKPKPLKAKEWWRRMQSLNRYLCYFFPTMNALKKEFPGSMFTDWWKIGSMTDPQLHRIVLNNVPRPWHDEYLKQNHINQTTDELIGWFSRLESLEEQQQFRASQPRRDDPRRQCLQRSVDPSAIFRSVDLRRPQYGSVDPNQTPRNTEMNSTQQTRQQFPGRYQNRYQERPFQRREQDNQRRDQTNQRHDQNNRFRGQGDNRNRSGQRSQAPQQPDTYRQDDHFLQEDREEEELPEQQFATEEEFIDAWNESLYLDAPIMDFDETEGPGPWD